MDVLKRQRCSIKGKITRVEIFLRTAQDVPRPALLIRLESLENAWTEYNLVHNKILASDITAEIDAQESDYIETKQRYFEVKLMLTCEASTTIVINHANVTLSQELKQFWELEEGPKQRHLTPEEHACEEHFLATYSRDASGRFMLRLPRKEPSALGRSRDISYNRLCRLEKSLERNKERREQYHEFMSEYLALGHMEVVPNDERLEKLPQTNYLPHHCLTKDDSTTTSLRVVFDASAKTSSGTSLNEMLMVGPKLQGDIWNILIRFRLQPYALTADIAKMYQQVWVSDADVDLQRILWRKSSSDPVTEYRLTTLTYGTASAPYLAVKALQHLAKEESADFPLAAEVVLYDFYVDDLISGVNTLQDGLQLQWELTELLRRGGFHLRKWSSNNLALVESVPEEDRNNWTPLRLDSFQSIKTLGIHWSPAQDYFTFTINLDPMPSAPSKRNILATIARIYDPLGLVSPVVVGAKLMLQKLWIAGVSWDDTLPLELENEWLKFRGELHHLTELQIPRYASSNDKASHELHGFCDASEKAYVASVYMLSRSQNNVTVHLLCSKTRVAPVQQVSLPRLELCGALLLAQLLDQVQKTLVVEVDLTFAWTDSRTVLSWITGLPRQWKTFVANRVSDIQQRTSPSMWKHVPSAQNPADLAGWGGGRAIIRFVCVCNLSFVELLCVPCSPFARVAT